ncbi:MAG TPA: dihydrodipicolinate synthase family protein [Bryobacteraceae bacterium]|nr:dihydrodipicolinate synthase family protein [Bryobacteraceae bacterium]
MKASLAGVLPALVTPLTGDERLARKPMEQLLERMYAAGVDGVYVCGQTGEGLLLPLEERRLAAELAVRNSPAGKSVVAHVGAGRTADAVELARHARELEFTPSAACRPSALSPLEK